MKSYRELIVWQKAINLCVEVYKITEAFPKTELYSLTSQIRRAVVSIPSNIAEGYCRGHRPEYIQFLRISFGSGAELETQLLIAHKIGYLDEKYFKDLIENLNEIMKMLNKLIDTLQISTKP